MNKETDPEKLIPNLRNRKIDPAGQRRQLDLLGKMNRQHSRLSAQHPQLESAIQAMETAFRMQAEAHGRLRYSQGNAKTRGRATARAISGVAA